MSFFLKIAKYLPGLSTVLGKFFGDDTEIEKIKLETEREEIKGWTKYGRMTPKIYLKFGVTTLFFVIAIIGIAGIFVDDIYSSLDSMLNMLVKHGTTLLSIGEE